MAAPRGRLPIAHPDLAAQFARTLAGELPEGWEAHLPTFTPADGEMATRDAGGSVINALAGIVTNLVGGSADLDPSTRTAMTGCGDFESPLAPQSGGALPTQGTAGGVWGYAGRNIHFGLREHAMAAAMTGMALHGGVASVWRDLPVVLGLHAAQHPARGVEQGARDLCLDPRQHRAG